MKNKNLLISEQNKEIEILKKQLNENEEHFNKEEKKRIEKDSENKRYKQKIKELEEKLNDYKKTEKEKIYANIPYLENEDEAAYNVEEEADIYERKDDTGKKEKSDLNEYGINIDGLDKDGYNINGLDEYGLDRDGYNINGVDRNGYNINGIEGTRKKYSKRKINYKEDDDENLYDQYAFNSERWL